MQHVETWYGSHGGTVTPWGRADYKIEYAPGIASYCTPSHGGYKVAKRLNDTLPEVFRNEDGWYEEDCDWAHVVAWFPQHFEPGHIRDALDTLRGWHPEAYEFLSGTVLQPGESHVKDERQFQADHETDWIVRAAIALDAPYEGQVKVTASLGGHWRSDGSITQRTFLIPAVEYETRGRFGFIVDPARHPLDQQAA